MSDFDIVKCLTFVLVFILRLFLSTAGNPCSSDTPLDLAEYDGTFTTTNYPSNYSDNSDCQWRLSAIEGSGVSVHDVYTNIRSLHVVSRCPP